MLQRIQSLLLAAVPVLVLVLFFLPLYSLTGKTPETSQRITLLSGALGLIIHLLPAGLALFTIFKYNNRLQQIKLCMIGMLLSGLALVATLLMPTLLFPVMKTEGTIATYAAGIFLLPVTVLLFFAASRFIRKDEELVRSADRLR